MRVLVTGSRTWNHASSIRAVLDQLAAEHRAVHLVHGACPRGADAIAANWALVRAGEGQPVTVEAHPADWRRHGTRRAGIVRNNAMVALGADLCVAFWRESTGTAHCMEAAANAGIDTRVYLWDDRDTGRWVTVAEALQQQEAGRA